MWTPKRVLLLASGFVVYFVGYLAYAHVLGGIDGLPPLPASLMPVPPGSLPSLPPVVRSASAADEMLQTAFGAGAPELKRPVRVGSSARGVALAADDWLIDEKDSRRILLKFVSLAMFSKVPGKFPRINTLRAQHAYLILDRAISGPNDINARKITAAELTGDITIVHNRGTQAQDDDIHIHVRKGPVYFDDIKRTITTNDTVELEDMESQPKPMHVKALGMDVFLAPNNAKDAKTPRTRSDRDGSVERIVLRSNVDMHLYIKPGSGFLTPARDERPAPQVAAKAQGVRDHIHVVTSGPFDYDLLKDIARFDIPANPERRLPERVVITRNPEQEGKRDSLECEHLVMQLRRKSLDKPPVPPAAPVEDRGDKGMEIETAHATGKDVVIRSEAEFLDAHGNELIYEAKTRRTVLRGEQEIWLLKKGNEIHARELDMVSLVEGGQRITSRGAGRIHLLDEGGKRFHARWKESFTSTREGTSEVITLVGEAAFVEDDASLDPRDVLDDRKLLRCKTLLRGDTLKVWLEPRRPTPPGTKPGTGTGTGPRPRQVEANGNVLARSAEMYIHDTKQLIVIFRESPPVALPPAGPPGPALGLVPPPASSNLIVLRPDTPGNPEPVRSQTPPKTPRPIELSARFVKATILRGPEKNELDLLNTEGSVHVVQAGAGPEDKGVDIRGATLTLERKPGGNLLIVRGDDDRLAELRLDKLTITSLQVNIDQAMNRAWVDGAGAMQMESLTDFQGNKLTRPVPLEVLWNALMDFDGSRVEFHGGVQAEQGNARLKCENLYVLLDRAVSLKEGPKGPTTPTPPGERAQGPHARKLNASNAVWVTEKAVHKETGRMTSFQRLDCTELNVLTEDGAVRATGPGWARVVQPGMILSTGDLRAPNKPASEDWGLTVVSYVKLMIGDNRKRTAEFYGDVDVINIPWEAARYNEPIDVNLLRAQLPPGGVWMRGQHLIIYAGGQDKGRRDRTMDADGSVTIKSVDARGQVYWGTAEQVHYDEEKDQLILDGKDGYADLHRIDTKGAQPKSISAKVIYFYKTAGTWKGKDIREVRGATGGP